MSYTEGLGVSWGERVVFVDGRLKAVGPASALRLAEPQGLVLTLAV